MSCRLFLSIVYWLVAIPASMLLSTEENGTNKLSFSHWMSDYAKAEKLAQVTGKPLLLAFVGSDWCPWSTKIQTEILCNPEFAAALREEVIFVLVDFPEKNKISLELKTQNQGLKNRYGVQELPTLVLVDHLGDVIVKMGYLPLDAQSLAAHLRSSLEDFIQLKSVLGAPNLVCLQGKELENLYQKASHLDYRAVKERLMEVGLKSDRSIFFLLERYEELLVNGKLKDPEVQKLRREIVLSDPSNSQGTHFKLAMAEFNNLSQRLKKKENPHRAIAPLTEYLRQFGSKDRENVWKVEMVIAQYLFSKNFATEALQHARNSYEYAPEDARCEIAQSIEYLNERSKR